MKKNLKGLTALWLALIMVLTMVPTMGAAGAHGNHAGWTDITTLPKTTYGGGMSYYELTTGQYVLNADFTGAECIVVGMTEPGQDVTICLNGHDAIVDMWEAWLITNGNNTVTICSCCMGSDGKPAVIGDPIFFDSGKLKFSGEFDSIVEIPNGTWAYNGEATLDLSSFKGRITLPSGLRQCGFTYAVNADKNKVRFGRFSETESGAEWTVVNDYVIQSDGRVVYETNHNVYLMDIPFSCTASVENHFGDGLDDWYPITTQGSLRYTYTVEPGGTVTLPTHKNPCEQNPDKGYAWIFMGWENCDHPENELLPGGTYTNDQIHQWGLKQSSGGLECWGYTSFRAAFDYGYKVDVSDGSGDNYYAEGQSVTIKADAISGKRFKKWEVTAAPVDIPRPCALSLEDEGSEGETGYLPELEGFDATAATTTFVMPGEVALTFTATYEDAPVTPSYDWYIPAPEEVEPETEDCWKVNCNKLNVRKAPNLFSGVITKLNRGDCINKGELTEDGKWIRFEVEKGVYGYVAADYVIACDCLDHIDLPMEKIVLCRKLNVRSGAGTSFAKVGNLTRGETVKIISCDCNGWVKIEYNGGYAWISTAYIG